MSSRRNGSVSRAAEAASKNRLHMDRNPQHSRITDPSNPAGRRKEIDNVMKRARQASPGSWDRKLLEVEEKDPNRWRHTGYKQMYLDHSGSGSPRRSRSPPPRRSRSPVGRRSRSPLPRRSRSPVVRRSRSPVVRRSRSPVVRRSRSPVVRRSRSPVVRRSRSPIRREIPRREPRRTPPRRSPVRRSPVVRRRARSPLGPPPGAAGPAGGLGAAARPRPPPRTRPPSPPPRRSSGSGSSVSSCSDESCSVCSAKNRKPPQPPPQPRDKASKPPPPTRSPVTRPKRPAPAAPAANSSRAVQPTRELLKAREASKRSREEKVLEWQRSQMAVNSRPAPIPPTHIKREGERRPPPPQYGGSGSGNVGGSGGRNRPVSPAAIAAALADTATDTESEASDHPPPRLTLSERFGKMAQWSADRSALTENMNMKITRRDSALHVHIAREDPPPRTDCPSLDGGDVGVGSYPSELLAVAPAGLSWDDVRVRYDYYKKRGYLRGLTLSDYVKWEDWWYKYQEWLKRERAYERWAEGELTGNVRRERRRRGGRHRRS